MAKHLERTALAEEICEEFDITDRTLRRYVSEGCPCDRKGPGRPNVYNVTEVAAWMKSNNKTGEPGRPREADPNRDAAELRKITAQADNWEIRNEQLLSELVPAVDVRRAWVRVAQATRAAVMRVPASLAPALFGQPVKTIESELEAALAEALKQVDPDIDPPTAPSASTD